MLGGTELILKKDKGNTESELVREDWMNKPVEEMTNEEQEKLKEFDFSICNDKNVCIFCSVDAIVPTWAYMLLAIYIEP